MCLNGTYPFCQQPLSGNCHSICFSKPVLWTATRGCSFFCALSSARRFCSPKGLLLSLHRAGGESKGPFSFAKENGPFGTPRERLRLAVSSSNDFCASGVEVPAWRYCFARRQWFCKTICLCSYHPLLRSRWRLCCLTDAAHPLRVPLCPSCRSTA